MGIFIPIYKKWKLKINNEKDQMILNTLEP